MKKYIILGKEPGVEFSLPMLSILVAFIAASKIDGNSKERYISSRKLKLLPNFYISTKSFNKLISRCFNDLEQAHLLRFDDEMRRIWIPANEKVWHLSDSDEEAAEAGNFAFDVETIRLQIGVGI